MLKSIKNYAIIIEKIGAKVMQELKVGGTYRHYKGNFYKVLGLAKHSETLEELVVYEAQYGERGLWVRPKTMFLEVVVVDGEEKARFELVE
jgi:hypothetical protein